MKWKIKWCWLFAIFAKMTNLVKIANLAISNEWLAKNSNEMAKNGLLVIRDFTRTANLGENGKFGKNTWKIWTKFNWEDSKGYFDNYWFFAEEQKWRIWQTFIKCLVKAHTWVDQTKACENLGTIWNWISCGPWSNGAEMTEKYLTFDVTLLSRRNNLKAFLLSLTKIYPLTEILPSMHRDGIN